MVRVPTNHSPSPRTILKTITIPFAPRVSCALNPYTRPHAGRATNIAVRIPFFTKDGKQVVSNLVTNYSQAKSRNYPLICSTIMAEDLKIIKGSKTEQYETIIPQILAIVEGEPNQTANLANVAAALKEQFGWLWVGFYLVDKEDELVLGPFQGPVACTRIRKGKGVCGTAWQKAETIIVPDVEKFPGHIACSSASKSEIVVPIIKNGTAIGVLDVDSEQLNAFDETDKTFLENLIDQLNLT